MKRILFLFLSVICCTGALSVSIHCIRVGHENSTACYAFASAQRYGLIGEGAMLLDEGFEAISGLPPTYFVIILGESQDYYSVEYSDLSGYIAKSSVFEIDYEPKIKFGSALFTAQNDTHPVNIRSFPSGEASVVATIPNGESALYYGSVSGEALIPAAGGKWYYVKYNNGTNKYGYVYSVQGNAVSFAVNSGEPVEAPVSPIDSEKGAGFPDWAFILLLCIPAVIIMLALFARPKHTAQSN